MPLGSRSDVQVPFTLVLVFALIGSFALLTGVHVSADTQADMASALVQKGDDLMLQKKYLEALETYKESVSIDPYNSIAWNKLGIAHQNTGRYQDAIDAFRKATEIDPYSTSAWNNLGDSQAVLGKNAEAIDSYNRALMINPNDLYALLHKAMSLQMTGDASQAMGIYEEVIRIADREMRKHPNYATYDAEMWVIRGEAFFRLGRFDESLEDFNKALEINPKSEEASKGKSKAMDAILLSKGSPAPTTATPTRENGAPPLPTITPIPAWITLFAVFSAAFIVIRAIGKKKS